MNIALWIVAGLLALLMLNAATKLFVPKDKLATKYGRGWMRDNSVGFVKTLVDLAVENVGGDPGDFRRGLAAFHAHDGDASKRVFAVCGTSSRVIALHEHLGVGGAAAPFIHVVESPYEDFDDDFTRLRSCEITLDRSRSTASWLVDGHSVYEAHTFIPERVRLAFGIWTMLPIRDGRSRSLSGQGVNARWRRFRVSI
jgi:hypothetical protein